MGLLHNINVSSRPITTGFIRWTTWSFLQMSFLIAFDKRTLELISIYERVTLTLRVWWRVKWVFVYDRQVPIMSLSTFGSNFRCKFLLQFVRYFEFLLPFRCWLPHWFFLNERFLKVRFYCVMNDLRFVCIAAPLGIRNFPSDHSFFRVVLFLLKVIFVLDFVYWLLLTFEFCITDFSLVLLFHVILIWLQVYIY